jgi:hypothetical protein
LVLLDPFYRFFKIKKARKKLKKAQKAQKSSKSKKLFFIKKSSLIKSKRGRKFE